MKVQFRISKKKETEDRCNFKIKTGECNLCFPSLKNCRSTGNQKITR